MDPPATSAQLKRSLGLRYPLLSDEELRVIRAFGVEMQGQPIALPATFVLAARSGRVRYRHVGETVFDRPQRSALLAAVEDAATP